MQYILNARLLYRRKFYSSGAQEEEISNIGNYSVRDA